MIIRVDDYPGTKPEEFWRHNLDNYKRFEELFAKRDLTFTLGVIPRHVKESDLEYFRQSPTTYVALHGVYHDERFPNEFRDHQTEDEVYQAIQSAKEPLKGCNPNGEVTVYIPPHNVIDHKTVNALARADFREIWGGPESDVSVLDYARSKGIWTRRHNPPWYGRSDEMLGAKLDEWIRKHPETPLAEHQLAFHWTWEWNIGLQSLDEFLKRIADAAH